MMAGAIRRAGSPEPLKIKEALAATRGFEGVTGRIDMDANRNASKPATILKIEGGKFLYLKTVTP
jgi:branched-chain amino acid transport system substrate-binding protein